MGITRFFRERAPAVHCISVEPDAPFHGLEGMKHMASAMVPKIYDPTLAESRLEISTEDAYAMCRRLAREEGVFVGPSAGANVTAALSVASRTEMPATIVTVLCDGGGRYLSENFWTAA
jgi:cysteine synthase B